MVILDWRSGNNSLRLAIEGYQFPGSHAPYDNEWLMITGDVSCAEGAWSFRDPCLMSSELSMLADFLSISEPKADTFAGPFLEPYVWFTRTAIDEVKVNFWQLVAPPWGISDDEAPPGMGYPVRFTLSADDLAATAKMMRLAAKRFPPQRA